MKLTIKANADITNALIIKRTYQDKVDGIYSVEIDFDSSYLWSDLEFWLEDENGNYCDHAAMNVSKRKKMQFHK